MANCKTKYCRNDAVDGRSYCSKCRSRRYKKKHPFRYHYNLLRCNANRRGKNFELSFKEFKQVWQQSGHWPDKLTPGECKWQVDRIDVTRGYVDGNIQIISKRRNVQKYIKHGRFKMEVYWAEKNGQQRMALDDEAPF